MDRKLKIEKEKCENIGKESLVHDSFRPSRDKRESALINAIRRVVYLILFTPLVVSANFLFPFVGPKGIYLMALTNVVFFAWLVLIIYSPEYRPKKNALSMALGVFLIILTLATIFGVAPSRSFWSQFERMSGTLIWWHFFALFLVLTAVFKKKKDWQKFFSLSIVVATFVSILFFLEQMGARIYLVALGGSTLGNSSFLATYLLFNLYFAIYIFREIKKGKDFDFWFFQKAKTICLSLVGVATIIMLIALMRSEGESAILSFWGGLVLLGLFYWAFELKQKNWRKLGKIVLFSSVIVFLSGVILLHQHNSFVQRELVERRGMARPLVWQIAWNGFLERPILGWGPQNFSFVLNRHFNPCLYLEECGAEIRFDEPHNNVMAKLVGVGIFGLLGYLSILGAAFWLMGRGYYQKKIDFWTAALPTALLVAHFTQNLTVFDMPTSFLMFFLTLGFVASVTSPKTVLLSQETKRRNRGEPPVAALLAILIFILFCFSFLYFVIKPVRGGIGALRVMRTINYEERFLAYQQAFHSSPMGIYQIREHLAFSLFRLNQKGKARRGDFKILIEETRKSVESSPFDYSSHLLLGKIYNIYAEIDRTKAKLAEQVLERAIILAPTRQDAYWELARTKRILGKNQEAIALAEKAIELEPRVPTSHLFMVSLAKRMGKQELAEIKAAEAIEILPDLAPQLEQILLTNTSRE